MPSADGTLQGDNPANPVNPSKNDNDASPDIVEQSYLTYVVPSQTNIDLDKAFQDADAGKSIIDSLQQRDSLFFGEPL